MFDIYFKLLVLTKPSDAAYTLCKHTFDHNLEKFCQLSPAICTWIDRISKKRLKKCISAKKKKMYCLQERHEFEIKIRVRKKLQ